MIKLSKKEFIRYFFKSREFCNI